MKAYSHPRARRPPNQRPSSRSLETRLDLEERPRVAVAVPAAAPAPAATALDRDRACWHLHRMAGPLGLRLAEKAAELVDQEAWWRWGRARVQDFAHEKLDRCGRWLLDQAALGKALREEPLLRGAMYGTNEPPLPFTAALAIARAPKHVPMQRWIEIARESTVRELQDAIRETRSKGPPLLDENDGAAGVRPAKADGIGPARLVDVGSGKAGGAAESDDFNDPARDTADDDALQQEAYDDPETLAIHGVQVRMRMPRAIR